MMLCRRAIYVKLIYTHARINVRVSEEIEKNVLKMRFFYVRH